MLAGTRGSPGTTGLPGLTDDALGDLVEIRVDTRLPRHPERRAVRRRRPLRRRHRVEFPGGTGGDRLTAAQSGQGDHAVSVAERLQRPLKTSSKLPTASTVRSSCSPW